MRTPLADLDFRGVSRSFTQLRGSTSWPACRACGSSLYRRREATWQHGTGVLEVFRRECGTGRHVTRGVAAA
jgi:hypothetical protein